MLPDEALQRAAYAMACLGDYLSDTTRAEPTGLLSRRPRVNPWSVLRHREASWQAAG